MSFLTSASAYCGDWAGAGDGGAGDCAAGVGAAGVGAAAVEDDVEAP